MNYYSLLIKLCRFRLQFYLWCDMIVEFISAINLKYDYNLEIYGM